MPERDIFANFDRMRREMDELFGDVFERSGLARRRGGFSPPAEEGEIYQQVEIERGGFRRIVELAADVRAEEARASYEDGMLRVELPLVRRQPAPRHAVPIEPAEKQ
jgi:HSP20 family protein